MFCQVRLNFKNILFAIVDTMGLAVTKQEAFWEACGFGNKERVRKLIEEGIDVNWVSYTVSFVKINLE
jgi:hypothetical protein